jgi:hypothetical protein
MNPGVAGDGSGKEGRHQGGQAPRQEGHQHKYQGANHPGDEEGDEFGSRKSLICEGELATPPPANESDLRVMLAPTTRSQPLGIE